MKKWKLNLLGMFVFFASCDTAREEKHAVLDCILDKIAVTDTLTYELYLADPDEVAKYQRAGLMEEGVLEPVKKVRLKNAGRAFTDLTSLGKKYLVDASQTAGSKRNVVMAYGTVNAVTDLNKIGEHRYEAEYEMHFTNVSPFSKLTKRNYRKKEVHRVIVEWKEKDCVILMKK